MSKGKGVAVLGGSGGLGEASVLRLARHWPVTIGYFSNGEKAEKTAGEVVAAGGAAEAVRVDMSDSASVKAFIGSASAKWGGLRGVVSVTGPSVPLCPINEVDESDFTRIYGADVFGSFNVLKHGSKELERSGGGSIVMFLTTAVLRTLQNDGMSGCPKTALIGFVRQAARDLGSANIRCNGIAPGAIDAGLVHTAFQENEVAKAIVDRCITDTPLGRMGRPEEIASLVEYLLSDDAGYISGQVIAVDGGHSA